MSYGMVGCCASAVPIGVSNFSLGLRGEPEKIHKLPSPELPSNICLGLNKFVQKHWKGGIQLWTL